MKNFVVALFMAITVTDLWWQTGDGDKTKSVLFIEYSNGMVDKLVVKNSDLNSSNVGAIVENARKIMEKRTK